MHGHRLLTDGLAPAASRGYHYRLLAALEEFGPASQARLGGRAGVDRSDVVAALNDLSARGMVERTPDRPTGAATSSRSPRPAARTSGGSTGCWPRSRTSFSPRCHPPSGRNWCGCSPGYWSITAP
jgi:MarR family